MITSTVRLHHTYDAILEKLLDLAGKSLELAIASLEQQLAQDTEQQQRDAEQQQMEEGPHHVPPLSRYTFFDGPREDRFSITTATDMRQGPTECRITHERG